MTATQRINLILDGAKSDLLAIRKEPEPVLFFQRQDWQWRQDDAVENIVAMNTAAWLGVARLSHSDTTLCVRALDTGERRGLWRRVRSPGGRTTHLKLLGVSDA